VIRRYQRWAQHHQEPSLLGLALFGLAIFAVTVLIPAVHP